MKLGELKGFPEKEPEYGGTHSDVCMVIGANGKLAEIADLELVCDERDIRDNFYQWASMTISDNGDTWTISKKHFTEYIKYIQSLSWLSLSKDKSNDNKRRS